MLELEEHRAKCQLHFYNMFKFLNDKIIHTSHKALIYQEYHWIPYVGNTDLVESVIDCCASLLSSDTS